jgi:hypothetical protein
MNKHDLFLEAIRDKKKIKVIIDSKEKGRITRHCIPFDFGPSRKYNDQRDRYHFYDLDSPERPHVLSILAEQLVEIEILNEKFEPGDYVNFEPSWSIPRDWGEYS